MGQIPSEGRSYSPAACNADTAVSAYCDASWGNKTNGRLRYDFVTCFGYNMICWRSKVPTMVCLSTAESEYFAATECVKELVWLRGLLSELSYDISSSSVLLEDNQACITMASNARFSGREQPPFFHENALASRTCQQWNRHSYTYLI